MKKIFLITFLIFSSIAFSQTDSIKSDSLNKISERVHNDEVELSLFPNPTSKNTTLQVKTKFVKYYKIELTDMDGNMIRTIASQIFNNSMQSVYVETYGLSKGSYLLIVRSEGGEEISSIVLKVER